MIRSVLRFLGWIDRKPDDMWPFPFAGIQPADWVNPVSDIKRVDDCVSSLGHCIQPKPPAQSFSLRPGAINKLKA